MLKDRVYKFVYKHKSGFTSRIWIYGSWKSLGVFNDKQLAAMARLETLRVFNLIKLKDYTVNKRKITRKYGNSIYIDVIIDRSGKKLKIKIVNRDG